MQGHIYVYGVGGMGINCVSDIGDDLVNLNDSFSKFTLRTIDTTDRTINGYPELKDTFSIIKSTLASVDKIDGMSGERANKQIVGEIKKNVKLYMDEVVKTYNKHDYHFLIFSGSGGSGNVISTFLLDEMLKKDLTVVPIMVGDSSNLLYTNNTIKTLTTLYNKATMLDIALPIAYFDNNYNGNTTPSSEKVINDNIKKMLVIMGIFTSGKVLDLDHQDMNNFFIPSRYKTVSTEPGLYNLTVKAGALQDSNAFLARTIVLPGTKDLQVEVPLQHNKVGVVTEGENILQHPSIEKDKFPLFMVIENNVISDRNESLKKRYEELLSIKNVRSNKITGIDDSEEDDGFVI